MHAAERERLIQMYSVGDSSKAVPVCAGCLALLVLVVVLGAPSQGDQYAESPPPTAIAAAHAKPVGAQSEQHRQRTFEARRVAFTRDHP